LLGIVSTILIYVVKKLYDTVTTTYKERLAEKDAIIERLMLLLEVEVVPAMSQSTRVIQANTSKDAALTDRLDLLLSHIEAEAQKEKS
jgi:hypothetical protein